MPGTVDEAQCLHLLLYRSITGPCALLPLSQPLVSVSSPWGVCRGLPSVPPLWCSNPETGWAGSACVSSPPWAWPKPLVDTRQELWMDICVRIELISDPWGLGVQWSVLRNDCICHTVADKSISCVRFRGSAQQDMGQTHGPNSACPFSVFFGCFHAELRHFHRDPVTHKVPNICWLAWKGTKLARLCPAPFVALIGRTT